MSQPNIKIPRDPLVNCPACGLPAEIVDRFTLAGAPTPVEHVKIMCIAGHWYTPPLDQLLATEDASSKGAALDPGGVEGLGEEVLRLESFDDAH